ncbi:MAG: hypothetical protein K0S47_2041 [Herbinix sp.]|jgi:hypothetical protein|nr:hypothetical protein [Herbinix sp.]
MGEKRTIDLIDQTAVKEARDIIWQQYIEEQKQDEVRKREIKEGVMTYGDVQMRYGMDIIGEPDEEGYPLYIALHGGGQSDTPDMNDQQWAHMGIYYKNSVSHGIYVNPRGVRDTWDTHGNPESFPLYDRLIENMVVFHQADPNRVYLLGFSAGGDGVYIVAPRMADRLAATHMSAGHPNGTSVTNLYNVPIQLQVGMNDTAYDRHKVTIEYGLKLDSLETHYDGGYTHRVFVHKNKGHNFYDNKEEDQAVLADPVAWLKGKNESEIYADTNAIHFLKQYKREPLPGRIVWDLGNRGEKRNTNCFYWLKRNPEVTQGEIIARFDTSLNKIIIERDTTEGQFQILVNEEMIDLFAPILVETPKGCASVRANLSEKLIRETTYDRGDRNFQFVAAIDCSQLDYK